MSATDTDLHARIAALEAELHEAKQKQYRIEVGRAFCYVTEDGKTLTHVYDLPAERMPNGYDYAAEIEAAEADRDRLAEQVKDLQEALGPLARFGMPLDHVLRSRWGEAITGQHVERARTILTRTGEGR